MKKTLIYGTGYIAKEWLGHNIGYEVIGILDRFRMDGKFNGYPILTWDEVEIGDADALVIAAPSKYQYEIFDRIRYQCQAKGLTVFDIDGNNLTNLYYEKFPLKKYSEYFKLSTDILREKASGYDAISFDIFDTLVMRKVLEPTDVFDIVERRLRNKDIEISGFKQKRREAELETKGGNVFSIYNFLSDKYSIPEDVAKLALDEEVACEEECLIPRYEMLSFLKWCKKSGKRVYAVSDMYFPGEYLQRFLERLGIIDIDKIYVSCDYGKTKQEGLFNDVITENNLSGCLHIGDDYVADYLSARKAGLDAEIIGSSYDMLRASSFRRVLAHIHCLEDRVLIGNAISKIFNSPFALNNSQGVVPVSNISMLSSLCLLPIVLAYMENLYNTLEDGNYEGVIFPSRDGYLFKKIYDSGILQEAKIPSCYFYTSRQAIIKAWIGQDGIDEKWFDEYFDFVSNDKLTADVLMEEKDGFACIDDNRGAVIALMKSVYNQKRKQYENYAKAFRNYIVSEGVNGKWLLCELNSKGTTQEVMNKILHADMTGCYFDKAQGPLGWLPSVAPVYYDDVVVQSHTPLLETILASHEPSLKVIDGDGTLVFEKETRSDDEIEFMRESQNKIIELLREIISLTNGAIYPSVDYARAALDLVDDCLLSGELVDTKGMQLDDYLLDEPIYVFESD